MIKEVEKNLEENMNKCILKLNSDLSKVRTSKPNIKIFESIFIDYFNKKTSIQILSSIQILDYKTIKITPFDIDNLKKIDKSIKLANLNLTSFIEGKLIRVTFPDLTEETRIELIKFIQNECEKSKVTLRNIRRIHNQKLKKFLKLKKINKKDEKISFKKVQNTTDFFIKKVDKLFNLKKEEISII